MVAPRCNARPRSVQSYQDALTWLFLNLPSAVMQGVIERGEPLPSAGSLILDLYWINEAKLRRDLRRLWQPERFGPRMGDF